jgi:hypothetical protein
MKRNNAPAVRVEAVEVFLQPAADGLDVYTTRPALGFSPDEWSRFNTLMDGIDSKGQKRTPYHTPRKTCLSPYFIEMHRDK